MPSGKLINWEQYDDLFNSHLPSMTIEQFTQQFLSHISSKAVGARARKLCIKPAAKHLTDEQIQHLSSIHSTMTPEIIETIRTLRQTHSVKKIAKIVGRGKATIWRAINEHDIRLTP